MKKKINKFPLPAFKTKKFFNRLHKLMLDHGYSREASREFIQTIKNQENEKIISSIIRNLIIGN